MLPFYESFAEYDLPDRLKNEIYDSSGTALDKISNLSKINIFVGPNNNGKSLLIRELLKTKSNSYYSESIWQQIQDIITFYQRINEKLLSTFRKSIGPFRLVDNVSGLIVDLWEIERIALTFKEYRSNFNTTEISNHLHQVFDREFVYSHSSSYSFLNRSRNQINISYIANPNLLENIFLTLNELKKEAEHVIKELMNLSLPENREKYPKIYIPSVRTLRQFGIKIDIESETRNEYNLTKESILIYNGQDFPNKVFALKNHEYKNRQSILKFEEFLSHEFFESKNVQLTYHKEKGVLYIKIGDEQERPIHELGDGLQMIIILTFPFFNYSGGTVSIEEPELYIHPGMQKTLIKFLIENPITNNFQIFIATHSNHIIDAVNQSSHISLYSVRKTEKANEKSLEKTPNFLLDNLAHGKETLLNLLGITNTSVYLSNCTIWVEGITDKIYLQKYIQEYLQGPDSKEEYAKCKEYIEGINYSFALSGGDSIIHWDFDDDSEYNDRTQNIIVRKFCSKSMVIVDNDFGKNSERKQKLKLLLAERLIEHPVPEIENLLESEVICKTIMEYPTVAKAVGLNTLPVIEKKYFKTKRIGYIIDKIILKDYNTAKKFSGKSKSFSLASSEKYNFCLKAIKHINFDAMSLESKTLVEKILDFIKSNNS